MSMTRKHSVGLCALLLLAVGSRAFGVIIDADAISAVRLLAFPEFDPVVATPAPPNQGRAGLRQYQSGGIAGNGDVMGMATSERHGRHHAEDPVIWRRSENYEPRVVRGGITFTPYFALTIDEQFSTPLEEALIEEKGEILPGLLPAPDADQLRQVFADNGSALVGELTVSKNPSAVYEYADRFCEAKFCTDKWSVTDELDNHYGVFQHTKGPLSVLDLTLSGDEKAHGVHFGWGNRLDRHVVNVSEEGYVGGNWNNNNFDAVFYDMNTDVFVNLAGGNGTFSNNHRIVISGFADYSELPPAFVASPDAVTEENPFGRIHTFDPQSMVITGINDNNIIVGEFENNPIIIRPTGTIAGANGNFPTYDNTFTLLTELGPAFSASQANFISNSDPFYIVGSSFDFATFGPAGVVWDEAGSILQNLGGGRMPIGITDNGTVAYGSIRDVFGTTEEPALWYTTDNWENFTEVRLEDLLADLKNAGVPGAELVDTFVGTLSSTYTDPGCCSVEGINNAGQIVAHGFMAETGALRWSSSGVVFLLDTLALDQMLLKGDVNNDGVVDFIDITPFINAQSAEGSEQAFLALTPDGCFLCADIDMDGVVDFLDITPYVNLLDQIGSAALPEPASGLLLVLGLATMRRRRSH